MRCGVAGGCLGSKLTRMRSPTQGLIKAGFKASVRLVATEEKALALHGIVDHPPCPPVAPPAK